MTYKEYFKDELEDPNTNYFILDTKGTGDHADVDFTQYKWNRKRNNKVKEGDVFIYRRPSKSSETLKFYFFGAAKIGEITGADEVIGKVIKAYPFQEYIHQNDVENFKWKWKTRVENWSNFFSQYGINNIPKEDFESLLQYSERFTEDDAYDPEAAAEAAKDMGNNKYFVPDNLGIAIIRSKQTEFSNKIKTNYLGQCAFCEIKTKQFLVGSHIIPWSKDKNFRLDPSNGICLCSFHDKAFDKGFLTIDDDYKISVTTRITEDVALSEPLKNLNGKLIRLPKVGRPNKEHLAYHRTNIFDNFKD